MNNQTKEKAYNALLEIWDTYKGAPIHYRQQREIYMKHRTTLTLSHLLARCGFGTFPERGYFILNERPTLSMIEVVSKFQSVYQKECNANRKNNPKQATKTLFTTDANMDEESAIKLLKSLGYKLMKPIAPQYQEI